MTDPIKASDCKCVECGERAAAWWPIVDIDIQADPYCRKCLDEAKVEMMIRFGEELI